MQNPILQSALHSASNSNIAVQELLAQISKLLLAPEKTAFAKNDAKALKREAEQEKVKSFSLLLSLLNNVQNVASYAIETQTANALLMSIQEGSSDSLRGLACLATSRLIHVSYMRQFEKTRDMIKIANTAAPVIAKFASETQNGAAYSALFELCWTIGSGLSPQTVSAIYKAASLGLQSADEGVTKNCGALLAICIGCFGSGSHSVNNNPNILIGADVYKITFARLLLSLHELLDYCYNLIDQDFKFVPKSTEVISFLESNADVFGRKSRNEQQQSTKRNTSILTSGDFVRLFKSFSTALQRCLTQSYTFAVPIDVQAFLELVSRALFLSEVAKPRNKIDNRLDSSSYLTILPFIHQFSVKTLSALILSCRDNLLPFANVICDMLVQEMKACSTKTAQQSLPTYREICRCVTFALNAWGPCVYQRLCDKIIPRLITDITSLEGYMNGVAEMLYRTHHATTVELEALDSSVSKKKAKKKARLEKDSDEFIGTAVAPATSASLTAAKVLPTEALQIVYHAATTLHAILESCGSCIPFKYTHQIAGSIVASLTIWITKDPNNPQYAALAAVLYQTLLSTLLASRAVYTQSGFMADAINLFKGGVEIQIPKVSSVCLLALNACEAYLHPRAAPLYIPPAETIESVHNELAGEADKQKREQEHQQRDELRKANEIAELKAALHEKERESRDEISKRDERIRELEMALTRRDNELRKIETLLHDARLEKERLQNAIAQANQIAVPTPTTPAIHAVATPTTTAAPQAQLQPQQQQQSNQIVATPIPAQVSSATVAAKITAATTAPTPASTTAVTQQQQQALKPTAPKAGAPAPAPAAEPENDDEIASIVSDGPDEEDADMSD
eukprot:GEZU01019809.1.p1 GENE.GEZU01019809.1~~GEZU01019809.1.p1  ORF type:complete len:890 (+),score=239.30 GEZU01019809.1:104-2671(+)